MDAGAAEFASAGLDEGADGLLEAVGGDVEAQRLEIDAAATKKLRAKLLKQRGRNFQGELLSLVKLPHRMAVSPHKAAAKPKRKKAATRR